MLRTFCELKIALEVHKKQSISAQAREEYMCRQTMPKPCMHCTNVIHGPDILSQYYYTNTGTTYLYSYGNLVGIDMIYYCNG